jgi:hypothetical protein
MRSHQSNRMVKPLLVTAVSICCALVFAQASAGGTGLPADFPVPPGLSPCKPQVVGGEVICEWHNVDQHATYAFYLAALPKAGYTLLPGAREANGASYYLAAIGFKKGKTQGALTINSAKDLTVQVLPAP